MRTSAETLSKNSPIKHLEKYAQFINAANKIALKSDMAYKIGAVIVRHGKIIAHGHNINVCELVARRRLSLHAEIMAISQVPKHLLRYCDIYIVRAIGETKITHIHPCNHCVKILLKYKLRNVYYVGA